MRKQLIYAGMLLLAVGFTACNEDFTDWEAPQSNAQEDAATQVTANFTAGKDAHIVMHEATMDSVEICKLASTTAPAGSEVVFKSIAINKDYTIPFSVANATVKVALAQLDSVTQAAYKSRASIERELKIEIAAAVTTPEGEGLQLSGNEVTIKLTPDITPEVDPNGYYIVGDFKGWEAAHAIALTAKGDNQFELEIEASKEATYFKIFPAAALVGGELNWDLAMGSAIDGDTSGDNFLVWDQAQAIQVAEAGKIKITLDMTNFRFTVKDNSAPTELYMTGSAYGWGATWAPFVAVNGTKGAFWGVFHFEANEEVKFAPQADWGNDFGFAATIEQTSIDRAGLSDAGGNIKVGKAGWYLVYVSVVGDDKMVAFEEAAIYLTGDCSGGWDLFDEARKFTIPAAADEAFVSPAFVAGGDIRICVRPSQVKDWWRTEFIILDGKIAYRGNDGDQKRVTGTVGQKAFLNFSNQTGKVE